MEVLPVERPRIFGIETEYGVHPSPAESLTCVIINDALPSYLHPAPAEFDMSGGFNEYGRIYPDQGKNLEVCTPELLTLDGLLASHFAGEALAKQIAYKIWHGKHQAQKRTLDSDMQSRGEHDNFLVGTEFGDDKRLALCGHLATRIVLTGCGGVIRRNKNLPFRFVLDQRAAVTQGDKPIDNSSIHGSTPFIKQTGESFDDTGSVRRLQVVCSSQNMFPYPVAARIFNTSSVIRLLEHNAFPDYLHLKDPLKDPFVIIQRVNNDSTLTATFKTATGKTYTATQYQQELMQAILKLDDLPADEKRMAKFSGERASDLEQKRFETCMPYIEWLKKQRVQEQHADKHGYGWPNVHSAQIDIKWHELSSKGIALLLRKKGEVAMMPSQRAIDRAKRMPPDQTRGLVRARAFQEAARRGFRIAEANWNSWRYPSTPKSKVNDAEAREYFEKENARQAA